MIGFSRPRSCVAASCVPAVCASVSCASAARSRRSAWRLASNFAECRNARISLLTRHAPTWRPLDRAILPPVGGGPCPLAAVDDSPANRSTRQRSPAYRLNLNVTRKKGRKEGTWGQNCGVGAKAPAFKLPRDGGGTVSLDGFQGPQARPLFLPRADTPGCTREAIDFRNFRRIPEGRNRRSGGLRRSGRGAGQVQEEARADRRARRPTRPTRCSRPMAPGAKNPCTARPSWGSSARPC